MAKSNRLSIRLDDTTKESLDRMCAESGYTPTYIVEELLKNHSLTYVIDGRSLAAALHQLRLALYQCTNAETVDRVTKLIEAITDELYKLFPEKGRNSNGNSPSR